MQCNRLSCDRPGGIKGKDWILLSIYALVKPMFVEGLTWPLCQLLELC